MNATQLMQQQRPFPALDKAGINHGYASHFLMVIFTLTACLCELAMAQVQRLERDVYESRMGSTLVAVEELPGWTDPKSGARIVQLTSEPVTSSNVHMEQRFASADGQRIVIQRFPFGRPPEVWVCDLSRRMMLRISEGRALTASHSRNAVYYVVLDADKAESRLMRLDLADLPGVWRFGSRKSKRLAREQSRQTNAGSWAVLSPQATTFTASRASICAATRQTRYARSGICGTRICKSILETRCDCSSRSTAAGKPPMARPEPRSRSSMSRLAT